MRTAENANKTTIKNNSICMFSQVLNSLRLNFLEEAASKYFSHAFCRKYLNIIIQLRLASMNILSRNLIFFRIIFLICLKY